MLKARLPLEGGSVADAVPAKAAGKKKKCKSPQIFLRRRNFVLSLLLHWWVDGGGKTVVHAWACATVEAAPAVLVLRGGAEQGPRACGLGARSGHGFRIADHQYPVTALAVTPGGGVEGGGEELLISADGSGLIIVWETSTFGQLAQLQGHKRGVASLALR